MKSYTKIFLFATLIKNMKYGKINSLNPLYLIISRENGYFEKNNKISIRFQFLVMRAKKKIKKYKQKLKKY